MSGGDQSGCCVGARCDRVCHWVRLLLAHVFSQLGLCATVAGYTVVGALLFERLEGVTESDRRDSSDPSDRMTWHHVNTTGDILLDSVHRNCIDKLWNITVSLPVLKKQNWSALAVESLRQMELDIWSRVANQPRPSGNTQVDIDWSFSTALLYSVTVITTIGYGHITPKTDFGKLATIFYALLGIPLMLLCLSNIGQLMAETFRIGYWWCRTVRRARLTATATATATSSRQHQPQLAAAEAAAGRCQLATIDGAREALEVTTTSTTTTTTSTTSAPGQQFDCDATSNNATLGHASQRSRPFLDTNTRHLLIECTEYILAEQLKVTHGLDPTQRQLLRDIEHAKNIITKLGEHRRSSEHCDNSGAVCCGVAKFPIAPPQTGSYSADIAEVTAAGAAEAAQTAGGTSTCAKTQQRVHFRSEATKKLRQCTESTDSDISAASSEELDPADGDAEVDETSWPRKYIRRGSTLELTSKDRHDVISHSQNNDVREDSSSLKHNVTENFNSSSTCSRRYSKNNISARRSDNGSRRGGTKSLRNRTSSNETTLTHRTPPPPDICSVDRIASNAVTNDTPTPTTGKRHSSSACYTETIRSQHVPIPLVLSCVALYICFGAGVFAWWERWRFLDGAYFCFITLSTIGFGDLVPGTSVLSTETQQDQLKLVFCCVYLVLGLAIIAMSFSLVQEEAVARCRRLGRCVGILYDSQNVE